MQDPLSVISQAAGKFVEELAESYGVKLARMYEILGRDCVYPKFKKFVRNLAPINPEGIRIIKADLDAFFNGLIAASSPEVCQGKFNDALFAAIQAKTKSSSRQERLHANRIAIAFLQSEVAEIEESINTEVAEREYFNNSFEQNRKRAN